MGGEGGRGKRGGAPRSRRGADALVRADFDSSFYWLVCSEETSFAIVTSVF